MTTAAELFLRFHAKEGPIVPFDWDDYDEIVAFLSVPENCVIFNNDTNEYEPAEWWVRVVDGKVRLLDREILTPPFERPSVVVVVEGESGDL
jgi:hypothetical protein